MLRILKDFFMRFLLPTIIFLLNKGVVMAAPITDAVNNALGEYVGAIISCGATQPGYIEFNQIDESKVTDDVREKARHAANLLAQWLQAKSPKNSNPRCDSS